MKKELTVFIACISLITAVFASNLDWTEVTGSSGDTQIATAAGAAKNYVIKSMIIAANGAYSMYFHNDGTQVGPTFQVPNGDTIIHTAEDLNIEMPANGELGVWTSGAVRDWVVKYEKVDSDS